eukprot:1508911-Ditylum_brightwellii.AAC.1
MDALRKLADIFQTALPQENSSTALLKNQTDMRHPVSQPRLPTAPIHPPTQPPTAKVQQPPLPPKTVMSPPITRV